MTLDIHRLDDVSDAPVIPLELQQEGGRITLTTVSPRTTLGTFDSITDAWAAVDRLDTADPSSTLLAA